MQDKNLKFCMDQLRSLQNRDGLEPGQRSELERAMGGTETALAEAKPVP